MPVVDLPEFNTTNGDVTLSVLRLISIMIFPEDAAKRHEFVASSIASGLVDAFAEFPEENVSAEFAVWLSRSSRSYVELLRQGAAPMINPRIKGGTDASLHGGEFAAYILLITLIADLKHRRAIGRGATMKALRPWLAKRHLANSERHLDEIWERYKTVVHFWAAFVLLDGFPSTKHELADFLSLAELVRAWAVNFQHPRALVPFLDEESSWRVPEELLVPLQVDLEDITIGDDILAEIGIIPETRN